MKETELGVLMEEDGLHRTYGRFLFSSLDFEVLESVVPDFKDRELEFSRKGIVFKEDSYLENENGELKLVMGSWTLIEYNSLEMQMLFEEFALAIHAAENSGSFRGKLVSLKNNGKIKFYIPMSLRSKYPSKHIISVDVAKQLFVQLKDALMDLNQDTVENILSEEMNPAITRSAASKKKLKKFFRK